MRSGIVDSRILGTWSCMIVDLLSHIIDLACSFKAHTSVLDIRLDVFIS